MRILVTRPEEDAGPLVAALTARGHAAILEPVLKIAFHPEAPIDLAGVQALLFTSANGVRAFAAASAGHGSARQGMAGRDLPAFAVGDATAKACRDAGFVQVESAGGNVGDLARLVTARLKPSAGCLFHAAGSVVAGDMTGLLAASGFETRRVALYSAEPATCLSPDLKSRLAAGTIDAVLFFSPRTAASFVRLGAKAGLSCSLAGIIACCLSAAVAEAAAAASWRRIAVARSPTEAALLALPELRVSGQVPQRPDDAVGGKI
jgi:uroporphyrinogen-III synthase